MQEYCKILLHICVQVECLTMPEGQLDCFRADSEPGFSINVACVADGTTQA